MSTEVTQKDVENVILKGIKSIIENDVSWDYETINGKLPKVHALDVLSQAYQRIKCTPNN